MQAGRFAELCEATATGRKRDLQALQVLGSCKPAGRNSPLGLVAKPAGLAGPARVFFSLTVSNHTRLLKANYY
jgi:hypothetical protein